MEANNPVNNINVNASKLAKEDIRSWEDIPSSLVEELMDHFSPRVHTLSNYVYGAESGGVALSAFKEYVAATLRKGLYTFIFKNQHWRSGRSIGPYLLTCISKLADSLKSDIDFVKKVSIPICPACKTLGDREYLIYDGKMLRCQNCTRESVRLESVKPRTSRDEFAYRLRKVFFIHSRKGYRCPSCERFIPDSFVKTGDSIRISCPYDTCDWFGIVSELEPMTHPLGLSTGSTVSLNAPIMSNSFGSQVPEFQDRLDAQEINPDIKIEQTETYHRELGIAKSVIAAQKARFSKMPMSKVIKKYLMYQAFETLLEQDPAGMIGYLIRGKSIGERPIQSMIFQKYIQLIENQLPFEIMDDDGNFIEVFSLLDSGLNLFLGTSEYHAYVRESGLVSNNTYEIFVGAKCNGPCFIGLLCDITDDKGKSLLSEVEYYTFSNIKMKNTVPQNTPVKIVHFRIPPHYEMYSLVNLQRTRKNIVLSIRKRLLVK